MNSKQKIYSIAIIGAGYIGAGFDGPHVGRVLTHAHAVIKNIRTTLVGLVDADRAVGAREAARWHTRFFKTVEELYTTVHPDIVVIATPDATHVAFLKKLATYRPPLIICEKPVAIDRASAVNVKKLSLPPVIVNYSRRFDSVVANVKHDLGRGRYGKVIAAHGIYTGELLHNGSHLIDLARFLLGKDAAKLSLTQGDARAYSLFELDILAEKARLRFIDGGTRLLIEHPQKDPVYRNFRSLGKARMVHTRLHDALPALYRHAVAVLDGREEPSPSLREAMESERLIMSL